MLVWEEAIVYRREPSSSYLESGEATGPQFAAQRLYGKLLAKAVVAGCAVRGRVEWRSAIQTCGSTEDHFVRSVWRSQVEVLVTRATIGDVHYGIGRKRAVGELEEDEEVRMRPGADRCVGATRRNEQSEDHRPGSNSKHDSGRIANRKRPEAGVGSTALAIASATK
jgi:hypothetical protein